MTTLDKDLYTTGQIAAYLTISKHQVYRLVAAGKLKQTRLSERRVVYSKKAILDFLKSCEVSA
jgi:excisionase family DNA binding protein